MDCGSSRLLLITDTDGYSGEWREPSEIIWPARYGNGVLIALGLSSATMNERKGEKRGPTV